MAEAVATALWEVGSAWATDAAIFIASNAAIINTVAAIAASTAYSAHERRKAQSAAREAFNKSLQDRLVMTNLADAPRSRVYGRVRNVDGILFKGTHGENKRYYTLVIAHAGHEIDAFEKIYFNDVEVVLDADGWVVDTVGTGPGIPPFIRSDTRTFEDFVIADETGAGSKTLSGPPVDGVYGLWTTGEGDARLQDLVSISVAGLTASFTGVPPGATVSLRYQAVIETPISRVRTFTGAPGQDLSVLLHDLNILDEDGNNAIHLYEDRFDGIACTVCTFDYNRDAFPTGLPTVTALMRGAKVYDPRTGVTAWSENNALIARDWALYAHGGNCLPENLNGPRFDAAANACDSVTAFELDGETQSLPLYTCGIVCSTDANPWEHFAEIVESMAGKFGWSGGLLTVVAGAYRAPVATLTEDWITDVDGIQLVGAVPIGELVNVYRPTISDSAQKYVATPVAQVPSPADAATYIAADGQELPRDLTLGGVTDVVHGQHVCGVLLRDLREGFSLTLPCNLRAWPLELFDTINIELPTYGITGLVAEVLGWQFSMPGGVLLKLKKTSAAIFDPATGFSTLTLTRNSSLPNPWDVPHIEDLAVTSSGTTLDDGTYITQTNLTWSAAASQAVQQGGKIEVQYYDTDDSLPSGDWPSWPEEGSATGTTIPGLKAGHYYLFRVRAINGSGVRGQWSFQQLHRIDSNAIEVLNGQQQWSDVQGRPALFRVVSRGLSDSQSSAAPGLYDGETNTQIYSATRSYNLAKISRSTGAVTFHQTYDVFANGAVTSGRGAASLAADLNAATSGEIIVLWTHDEPQGNRLTGGLEAAIYRCGGSRGVFGSPLFRNRSAYLLVAIGGVGEGGGFEAYSGVVDSDSNAWCDVSFQIKSGNLIISGTTATPRTLADYSYTGDLNASADLVLVSRGNCVAAGNSVTKVGGAPDWDSDAYSRDGFSGGAYVSFVPAQTNANLMCGLNTDPATDSSYTSIDYAWYMTSSGNIDVYESGVSAGLSIPYSSTDVLAVLYDGYRVAYQQNGLTRRGPIAVGTGRKFFADTSFHTPGGRLTNIRFGPMSGVAGIDTPQLAPSSSTTVAVVQASGPVTATALSHTPDGYAWNTKIISSGSITPSPTDSGNVEVEVTVSFLLSITGSGGNTAYGMYSLQLASGAYNGFAIRSPAGVASGATISQPYVETKRFFVPGNVAAEFALYGKRANSTDTVDFKDIEFKVVVIKR